MTAADAPQISESRGATTVSSAVATGAVAFVIAIAVVVGETRGAIGTAFATGALFALATRVELRSTPRSRAIGAALFGVASLALAVTVWLAVPVASVGGGAAAAMMAGLGVGLLDTKRDVRSLWNAFDGFLLAMVPTFLAMVVAVLFIRPVASVLGALVAGAIQSVTTTVLATDSVGDIWVSLGVFAAVALLAARSLSASPLDQLFDRTRDGRFDRLRSSLQPVLVLSGLLSLAVATLVSPLLAGEPPMAVLPNWLVPVVSAFATSIAVRIALLFLVATLTIGHIAVRLAGVARLLNGHDVARNVAPLVGGSFVGIGVPVVAGPLLVSRGVATLPDWIVAGLPSLTPGVVAALGLGAAFVALLGGFTFVAIAPAAAEFVFAHRLASNTVAGSGAIGVGLFLLGDSPAALFATLGAGMVALEIGRFGSTIRTELGSHATTRRLELVHLSAVVVFALGIVAAVAVGWTAVGIPRLHTDSILPVIGAVLAVLSLSALVQ